MRKTLFLRSARIGKVIVSFGMLVGNLLHADVRPLKQPTIQERIDAVRKAMPEKLTYNSLTNQKGPIELAQYPWGNWVNWANWSNWSNWANFVNWGNF